MTSDVVNYAKMTEHLIADATIPNRHYFLNEVMGSSSQFITNCNSERIIVIAYFSKVIPKIKLAHFYGVWCICPVAYLGAMG